MTKSLSRTDREIAEIYERRKLTVYRVCFAYMKNTSDTEDAVQDAFFRLIKTGPAFESEEHEKAWLIRTAANVCKNALRSRRRKRENSADYENLRERGNIDGFETGEVFGAVMSLPEKYKTVVYLYYYEGYDSVEISKILVKPQSTIRNYLHEARSLLRKELGDDFNA